MIVQNEKVTINSWGSIFGTCNSALKYNDHSGGVIVKNGKALTVHAALFETSNNCDHSGGVIVTDYKV